MHDLVGRVCRGLVAAALGSGTLADATSSSGAGRNATGVSVPASTLTTPRATVESPRTPTTSTDAASASRAAREAESTSSASNHNGWSHPAAIDWELSSARSTGPAPWAMMPARLMRRNWRR